MALREDDDVVRLSQFKGLRNTVTSESFEAGDLEVATNVDITDALRIRRRKGYSAALSSGNYHSLWASGKLGLVVSGTVLYRILPDYTLVAVRTGLTAGLRMSYAIMGDRVFYSNTVQTGIFQAGQSRSWGIAPPVSAPTCSAVGGSLPAGRYQCLVVFIRDDGQLSGSGRSTTIELTTRGGISLTGLPVSADAGVSFKQIYMSPVNGDALYLTHTLANAATSAVYTEERTGGQPLATQFLRPAPAGQVIAVFGGYTLVGLGDRLYRSEPWSPELFDLRKALPLIGRITLVAPMDDGVYLGTDTEIGWVAGQDPAKWEYQRRSDFGAIPGTLAYVPAEDSQEGAQSLAAMMATAQGVCVGYPGGTFSNLTHDRFNYPAMDEGAGVVRDNGGSIQYLATLQGTERAANVAF